MGKRGPKSKAEKGGRPPKITEIVLSKLEQAFSMGCGDVEACLYADISTTCLYEYQKKHPKFADRKAELKQNPILKARVEILKGLENNPEFSLKVMERINKKEFSLKSEFGLTDNEGKDIDLKEIVGSAIEKVYG